MPHVSAEAMGLHLAEIAGQVAPDAHAVVVLDGAGWHQTGGRLRVPDNITLLPLPPYAPELNPIENLWEYLRGNLRGFRIWHAYEAIRDACCDAWNALIADRNRLVSITTRGWASVTL
jgi:DDE superfamily endonuclease